MLIEQVKELITLVWKEKGINSQLPSWEEHEEWVRLGREFGYEFTPQEMKHATRTMIEEALQIAASSIGWC